MSNATIAYKQIIHGIQALRRKAELEQCPVLGGAGVRAFCYPHQLYVVQTVLSHTKVRHLLADEVGLGKTLESLMIMHALRIRNGKKLRVSIVVKDKTLAEQWRDEIYGRFPFPFWKHDYLATHPKLRNNNNVFFEDNVVENSPVDEFPSDGFHVIYRENFDEAKKYLEADHCDLLILDEIHSFGEALLNFIAWRSDDYQHLIVLSATPLISGGEVQSQLLKILNPDKAELDSIEFLRSRRRDFPRALPQREPKIIKIEPLENDKERFRKSRNLMQKLLKNGEITEENSALFIRRATIGGQTLSDRVDDYRNQSNYPQYAQYADELTEIRKHCSPECGDARFDALIDYLLEFFAERDRKLIIVAQDNPTIDYLATRISQCLTEVKILEFRQGNQIEGIIEKFWSGDEHILIAHDDAKQALNLQIADSLVFYSVPWNPRDMEQWIGRISRLGLRKTKTVEIVAIVLRDFIDEQIVETYQSLKIFDTPLDIELFKDILERIKENFRRMALYGENRITIPELDSPESGESLAQIVPKNDALKLDDKIRGTEDALSNWLDMLRKHELCYFDMYSDDNFKNKPNQQYYKFRVIDKFRDSRTKIPVLEGEPISTIPYVLERKHIQMPPRSLVPISRGRNREQRYEVPLQFFNFGSPLHDELIETFAKIFDPPRLCQFTVSYSSNSKAEAGQYLIGIVTTQRKRLKHESLPDGFSKSDNKTQTEMRKAEQRRLQTGLQADDRFLDLLLPGSLEIHGCQCRDNKWNYIVQEQFDGLLTVLPDRVERVQPVEIPTKYTENFNGLAQESTKKRWQKDFQPLLESRIKTLQQELQIRIDLLRFKIAEQERKINEETNEQTIRMNYEPAKKRMEEQLILVQRHFDIRTQYLTDSIAAAGSPQCECKTVLHIVVSKTTL
ncbi:MAG: DEAD/DEAH box helicase family protein [Thermoguttaceae bacterium]